jgi:GTPase
VPRAILVGIQVPSVDDAAHAASIEELSRLVKTLGYEVVGTMSQKRDELDGATVLGKGRLGELAAITGGTGVVGSKAIPPASALRTPTRRSRVPRRSSLTRNRGRSRS